MSIATETTIVGVFSDRRSADRAIDALYDAGFRADNIGVATRDQATSGVPSTSATKDATDNAGSGALAGAVAGAGIGGLIGLGVLAGVIPVIGPALFAGTLGAVLSNAAGGAAVAGIAGALVGSGVSEDHAKYYEGEFKSGRVIVTVNAGTRANEVRAILRQHGATSKDPAFASNKV